MKRILSFVVLSLLSVIAIAQDRQNIEKACMDYIEGFYEGDTVKITRALKPSLYKYGFWMNDKSGKYEPDGNMTFQEAVSYARKVGATKKFAKEGSPKKVEILDIMNTIAAAKITAWWGVDYALLSKQNDTWQIEEVLWEGPLKK